MPAIVDAIREQVFCGERTWPFTLDCREDVASIELDGIAYRLRPLRWREKRNLARYVPVGPEFIEKHFVRLCMVKPAELPQDPECREALAALARWINAPGEENGGLPLDSGLLAGVSLDLCRAIGCKAGDLDWQPAAELERLWASRRPTDAAPSPSETSDEMEELAATANTLSPVNLAPRQRTPGDPGDMNRIQIVPDPFDAPPPQPAQPVSRETEPATNPQLAPPHTAVESAATPAANTSRESGRRLQRFRVVLPTSVGEASRQQGLTDPQLETPPMSGWPNVSVYSAPPDSRQLLPQQRPGKAVRSEALFDELTERLEQAAEELGIDLEQ